jgi:hypothetical protein
VQAAAVDADDDDGSDFLLKDNGDDLDLRLERLEVRGGGGVRFFNLTRLIAVQHDTLL